ncbi:hypothetical protein PDL71_15210 [Lacibacter sp. MH-610]|uniref:hypothetical protein n=1 Tax=Lacibacter sp. MH-610 TaxID=3020883 RepID=UPI0038928C9A
MAKRFTSEALDFIKGDADCFAEVSKEMGIEPGSLLSAINRNTATLNQYSVVTLVANHMGRNPDELVEEVIGITNLQHG